MKTMLRIENDKKKKNNNLKKLSIRISFSYQFAFFFGKKTEILSYNPRLNDKKKRELEKKKIFIKQSSFTQSSSKYTSNAFLFAPFCFLSCVVGYDN